jgi:hypothetical protein
MLNNVFRKSCRLCDNFEKYGGAREWNVQGGSNMTGANCDLFTRK